MEVTIEKLDNNGRGICYVDNIITFVTNALPNEVVEIKLAKQSKKYNEAKVINYITTSPKRLEPICPYYNSCGGCELLHLSYEDTLIYKKDKLESIFKKYAGIERNIEIIPCNNNYNYRNKITLKVRNKVVGYYEPNTHNLVSIDHCYLGEVPINNFLKDIKYLNVTNGEIIIRSNYNEELLIWIKSKEEVKPAIEYLKSHHKIAGIILNNKPLTGDDKFIEIINNKMFQVSYDSFFQINRDICSKLFNLIEEEIEPNSTILDLYCGVGTLGINIAHKCNKVYGIEIIKNAILNCITNSKINKLDNTYYLLGDVAKCLPKIEDKIDTIIVDPPRAGLDSITRETILNFKPNKIIYVSCDPMTLARDLKELQELYNIKSLKGLDMFPMTQHCESITVLERR